ncbi:MAG: RsbRD N-terminal domain-containing protein [Desulfobacterales bacterium]|nr:RsbRD N-terminal domain-containing protein [Desulfobacterales bacterium]
MNPQTLLSEKRKEIVGKWFDEVIGAYPEDGAKFFKEKSDPFANPVGNTLYRCLNELFDEVIKSEMDQAAVDNALDGIVRIQSLQEFMPSVAIGFIFTIKPTISKRVKKYREDKEVEKYLTALDANIECLLRRSFDLYMQCRQKVFEFRANQSRDRVRQLLIKKGYIKELPEKGENLEDITT